MVVCKKKLSTSIFHLSFTSENNAAVVCMRQDFARMRCRSEIVSGATKRSRIPLLKTMGHTISLNNFSEENDEKLSQNSSGDDNEGKALLR